MTRRLAAFFNKVYSGGMAATTGALTTMLILFSTFWGIAEAAGIPGGITTTLVLAGISSLATATIFILLPIRWTIITWILKSNISPIVKFRPELVIGIGPGGAIIAGIISKQLSKLRGEEPLVYVMDREFSWERKTLVVSLNEIATNNNSFAPNVSRVLLVSSEVHSGNTMRAASNYLNEMGITHETFSLITSPSASIQVDHVIIYSDSRGILPWEDSPIRSKFKAGQVS